MNKKDSKMLSAIFKDGELHRIYYFDTAVSDAYPVVQMTEEDRKHCLAGTVRDCCRPCTGEATEEEYRSRVDQVIAVLNGEIREISSELKEQMRRGALMFNYSGHGAPDRISHARLLLTDDFRSIATTGIPLWVFASCEVATFDSGSDNIGRAALLYEDGGAVAVMCASRKVYSDPNRRLNVAFCNAKRVNSPISWMTYKSQSQPLDALINL